MGVFPLIFAQCIKPERLPHARGGVSNMNATAPALGESSPRTWGCFQIARGELTLDAVFPTHVGCFSGRTWNGFRVEGGKAGEGVKFELIRRITGYLVSKVERFNDAKRAEVMERVKHTV